MEHHHPIVSKLRNLGDQTYRQTDDTVRGLAVEKERAVTSRSFSAYGHPPGDGDLLLIPK